MITKGTEESKTKPPLSIQYLVSNRGIEEVFANPEMLPKIIEAGPDKFKEILIGLWNAYKEEYADVFELTDIDRKITKDDFQIKYDMALNKDPILFITFPDIVSFILSQKVPYHPITRFAHHILSKSANI